MVGPASTSCTAGRSGARPWRLATLGMDLGQLAGQLDSGGAAAADHHGGQAALLSGIGGGRGRLSAWLTASHTCSASPAEYTDRVRWARPGMAKSLAGLPSASTRRVQPIGPAPLRSSRPGRSKPLISVWTKRTRVASRSWIGMRTASAARVPPATLGSSVST